MIELYCYMQGQQSLSNLDRLDQLKSHIRQLMVDQLDDKLVYHSIAHTFDDVLPAAERIAQLEGIDDVSLELVQVASLLHDIGFIKQRENHEGASIQIAYELLPDYGYTSTKINLVSSMIEATRIPQTPTTLLDQIVADADLDVLGRKDFPERNQVLRDELAAFGVQFSDRAWFEGQLKFVKAHHYFTGIHQVREDQKLKNISWLEQRLNDATHED